MFNPTRMTLQSVNSYLMPRTESSYEPSLKVPPTDYPEWYFPLSPPSTPPKEDVSKQIDSDDEDESHFGTFVAASPTSEQDTPSTLFATLRNNGAPWSFTRTLSSDMPTCPNGTVTGTASFTPFNDPSLPANTEALLYAEEGEFATAAGLRFPVRRKYVYQLKRSEQEGVDPFIAVYFFESDAGAEESMGGLFVEVGDCERAERAGEPILKARNRQQHLCAEDLYVATWAFGNKMVSAGAGEKWWEARFDVSGPSKDYVSETRYTSW